MKKALRIYMRNGAKVKFPSSFWNKLWNPSLANYILKKARVDGIEMATYQDVRFGYLVGGKISYAGAEFQPPDLPTVLELIDDEEKLNVFYGSIKFQLSNETSYLLDIEHPKIKNLEG